MQDIRFVHDPQTKRRKPFAFVVFKHEESVQYAIKIFRDVKLFGRHIQMQHRSKPRTDVDRQRTISAPPQVFRPPPPPPGSVQQNEVQILDVRSGRHPDDPMRMQQNYQRQNSTEYHQQNYQRQNSDEQYQQQNYHRQNSDDNYDHRSRRDNRQGDHDRSYDGYSNNREHSERLQIGNLESLWDRQFSNDRGSFDQQQQPRQGRDSGYMRNDQQQWQGRGGYVRNDQGMEGRGGYGRNDQHQQQQWQGRDRSYDRNNDRNFDSRDRSRSRRR